MRADATSISPAFPAGIYFWRWLTVSPAEPQPAGTGRSFIPNSCAPRMRRRKPILAPGRRELARVHA